MKHELVKLALDYNKNNLGNYSKQDASEALRKAMIEVLGTDKLSYKDYRRHKTEFFEIIEEILDITVEDGFTGNEFFQEFVEYRNLNLGDTNIFHIGDNSLFNIAMIAEGNNNLRRQRLDSKTLTVTSAKYGVKIYEELNRFLAGRIDWGQMVSRLQRSFEQKIMQDIYTGFKDAYSSLPATFAKSGSFDEQGFVDLIQHVEAASGNAVILGTKNALRQITTAVVSEKAKEAYNDNGYYGVFNGTPIMAIKNFHTANTFNFALTDKDLYVVPANHGKPVKMIREGETVVIDNTNNMNMDETIDYTVTQRYGINVIVSSYFGVWRLP